MTLRPWVILLCLGLLIGLLYWRFSYMLAGQQDWMRFVYLALLASGILLSIRARKISWGTGLRHAAIWFAVIMGLVALYSYRDLFLRSRMAAELMPHLARMQGEVITLRRAEDGHFYLEAAVNGTPVLFMVDTGASDLVLSPSDAARAGLGGSLSFTKFYQTANGTVRGAPVRLASVIIGEEVFRDVAASVNEAGMERSLLGMSFLNRFSRVRFEGDTLSLEP